MALFKAVRKDLGTGSITGTSQQSYVVPYYVFTDNTTKPYNIYEQARSELGIMIYDENNNPTNEKLPVYGTVDSTTYVSNINIERASENNLIAVPQYGLAVNQNRDTSWTCWLYTITFTASGTTTITTSEAPWNRDTAISCSFSPKTYERYDNQTLIPNFIASKKDNTLLSSGTIDDTPVPNYPLYEEKYSNLYNTVGDDLYRNRTVYNYLLNFSYAVRHFDAEWLPLYMNTMNLKDCVICGIPIKKYHAAINEIRLEQAEWNGKTYYNVNVEVEIQYQQRITYDEYVSSGHRAFLLEGSDNAISNYLNGLKSGLTKEKAGFVYKITSSDSVKKYPVSIEELTDIRQRDKVPDSNWFMKKKNLGYFESIPVDVKINKRVPITHRVYLISGGVGGTTGDEIEISYIDINSPSYSESKNQTLYYTGKHEGNDYIYSTTEVWLPDDESSFVHIKVGSVEVNSSFEFLYYAIRYVTKNSTLTEDSNPLQGQYETIQTPLALNKFGGIYFDDNESTVEDNSNQPGRINMSDPMLGKVKDYQHIARDWTALAFPKRGMFWGNTSDVNTDAWNTNSANKYFK